VESNFILNKLPPPPSTWTVTANQNEDWPMNAAMRTEVIQIGEGLNTVSFHISWLPGGGGVGVFKPPSHPKFRSFAKLRRIPSSVEYTSVTT
jgi:hypothetical protein